MMAISVPKRKEKYNQTCMLGKGKFGREKAVALAPGSCPAVLPVLIVFDTFPNGNVVIRQI